MKHKINKSFIEQVIKYQSRQLKHVHRKEQLEKRLHPILKSFDYLKGKTKLDKRIRNELLKYIPISLISCMQGYFLFLTKDFIDFGEPFTSRITSLKDTNFSFESIVALQDRQLSLGQIVSYTYSFSNFPTLLSVMDCILNNNFKWLISNYPLSCPNCKCSFRIEELIPDFFANIDRTFQLRNIFAHEIALKEKIRITEIDDLSGSIQLFLYLSEKIAEMVFSGYTMDMVESLSDLFVSD